MSAERFSRRDFFQKAGRFSAGVIVGITSAEATVPVSCAMGESISRATGYSVDSAGYREHLDTLCAGERDKDECQRGILSSKSYQSESIVTSPSLEELLFRATPSLAVSFDSKTPIGDLLVGSGDLTMSRRELIVGGISSVFFGLVHNFKKSGIDTKTIPAPQMVVGMFFWYLQRKLGFFSNTLAHMAFNFKVTRMLLNS